MMSILHIDMKLLKLCHLKSNRELTKKWYIFEMILTLDVRISLPNSHFRFLQVG